MDDLFPFEVTPMVSPKQPCVRTYDSSDDEFALPSSSRKKRLDPTTTVSNATSLDLQTPSGARDAVDGGSSLPGAEASSAAAEVVKKADGKVDEKVDAKVDKKFDNTDLESFAQVKSQKDRRWGSIAKEELVWYRSFPALVVPPVLHLTVNSDIQIPTHDGVMTYGPSAKGVTPARKRYVILQYLPLCCSKSAKPACPFEKVAGNQVERVLPYNTRMGKKKNCSGEDGEFGPEGVWADTEHHFATLKNISKKGPNLTKENWKVAMDYAQKYLDRALELEAEAAEADRLEAIAVEEQRQLQKEEKEREDERRRREGVGSEEKAKEDAVDGNAEALPPSVPVVESKNLKLSPGDRIFFTDKTKIGGTKAARKFAIVLEIRTKAEALACGLGRLVLDRNQIIDDDCAIRKYVKDKKTGEVKLDHRWNVVKRYKLTPGKLEGVDVGKDHLMETLVSDLKKDLRDQGFGSQLRKTGRDEQSASNGDEADQSGDDAGQSGDESETAAETVAPAARKKGSPVRVSDAKGPGDGDSESDAVYASLTTRNVTPRKECDKGEGSGGVRPAAAVKDVGGGAAAKKNKKKTAERTHDDGNESQGKRKDGKTRDPKSGGGRKEVGGEGEPKKRKLSKLNDDEVEPKKTKPAKLSDDKAKPSKRRLSKSDKSEEYQPKRRKLAKGNDDDGGDDEPTKPGDSKEKPSERPQTKGKSPASKKLSKGGNDEPKQRRSSQEKPSERPQTKGKSPASKKLSKGGNDEPKQRLSSKEEPSERPKATGKSPASKAAAEEGDAPQRKRKSGGGAKVPSKKDERGPGRQKSGKSEAETQQREGKSGEKGAKPKVVGYSTPKKKHPQGEGQGDGVRSHHGKPGPRATQAAPPSSTPAAARHGGRDEKPR